MSRRCTCARLFTAFRADPRLRSLPWATRAFFLLLGEAMAAAEEPGVLPFSETQRVSLLLSVPETEAETQLETLEREGLLLRTAAGGLACPLLAAPAPRARAAQENGRKGGRPRKNETAEEARLRRQQGALALPIQGGAAETQAKPKPETPTTTTTGNSISLVKSVVAPAHATLGSELATLAGLDPVRQRFDYAPVKAWLGEGFTPAEIREAVRQVVTRPSFRPEAVKTLRYFEPALRRQREMGVVAAAAPASPAAEINETAFAAAYDNWRFGGMRGPAPRASAFRIAA